MNVDPTEHSVKPHAEVRDEVRAGLGQVTAEPRRVEAGCGARSSREADGVRRRI